MAKNRRIDFFWLSYSDLMTSLFFVMLTLFVVGVVTEKGTMSVIKDLRQQKDSLAQALDLTRNQYDKAKDAIESTKNLSKDYFEYNKEYEKYVLRAQVKFRTGSSDLNDIAKAEREKLKDAGRAIKEFLDVHKDTKYVLIIEGQASSDSYTRNYELSYERAHSLAKYWFRELGNLGTNCEILISGSGDGKLPTNSMRASNNLDNQRFLVHIIPKNIFPEE